MSSHTIPPRAPVDHHASASVDSTSVTDADMRRSVFRLCLITSVVGAILLAMGSRSAGAVRTRGGIIRHLGLDWITYGHAADIGNMMIWTGVGLLLFSWLRVGRAIGNDVLSLRSLTWIMTAMLVPMVVAGPLFSRDVYSYLMQGTMLRDGFDPYDDGAAVNPGPMLIEVSADWRNTTTPYGPLHLWIGEGITTVFGDNISWGVMCYKLLSIVSYALIAWVIVQIARHLGSDPRLALWLGVMNPVVFLHLVGGMHNESTMVALACLGLLLGLRRHVLWGAAAIGLGFSLKATALIALPFLVWIGLWNWRQSRNSRDLTTSRGALIGRFVVLGAGTVTVVGLVLAVVTFMSQASYGWISQLSGNGKVVNLLALPSLLAQFTAATATDHIAGATFNSVLATYRMISLGIMLLLLIVVWWRYRQNPRRALEGTAVAYLVTCIFNSVTLPWYYAAGLVLVGVYQPSQRVRNFTILASLFISLSFTGTGNNWLYRWSWDAFIAVVSVWLFFVVYRRDREGTLDDPFDGHAIAPVK